MLSTKPGQLITYMEGSMPFKPRAIQVYTSLIASRFETISQHFWETLVFNKNSGKVAKSLRDYTRETDNDIEQRAAQHYSVVSSLQRLGYKIVSNDDDLQIRRDNEYWGAIKADLERILVTLEDNHRQKKLGQMLEGIPSLDFTAEELMKIKFIKYLYDKEQI